MEEAIKMISTVAEIFKFGKARKRATREEILSHISEFIKKEKNNLIKMYMIVSASRTVSILEKNSKTTEKEAIKKMMSEIPEIISTIQKDNKEWKKTHQHFFKPNNSQ